MAKQHQGGNATLQSLVRDYVLKALQAAGSGMKALVMDEDTAGYVGTVLSHSAILEREVFLVETITRASPQPMRHLKGVFFLRPTSSNVKLLREHLHRPQFAEYHLFFTNIARDSILKDIAEVDEGDLVKQVQEYFADFAALEENHFSLEIESNGKTLSLPESGKRGQQAIFDRVVEGIAAVLMTLRRRPAIRYQHGSSTAKRVARDVHRLVYDQEAGLFDFRRGEGMVLLVVDRLNDPATPLLMPWTYHAMVHELVGTKLNRATVEGKEVVMGAVDDEFMRDNRHVSFGELGQNLKQAVDGFQQEAKRQGEVNTLEDMQRFVEAYPEFRKQQGEVSKHVSAASEVSKRVDERQLMRVSQSELEIASGDRQRANEEACAIIRDPRLHELDKARIACLFCARFGREREGANQASALIRLLPANGVSNRLAHAAEALLSLSSDPNRSGDSFSDSTFLKKASRMVTNFRGPENALIQRNPPLASTVENLCKGRLREQDFPHTASPPPSSSPPRDVLVFVMGGTTFEESRAITSLASKPDMPRIFLGGTGVLSSKSFLIDCLNAHSEATD